MNKERQKLIAFGVIVGLLMTMYTTFINLGMRQGFFTEGFWGHWLSMIALGYLVTLPFLLVTGYAVRRLLDRVMV